MQSIMYVVYAFIDMCIYSKMSSLWLKLSKTMILQEVIFDCAYLRNRKVTL